MAVHLLALFSPGPFDFSPLRYLLAYGYLAFFALPVYPPVAVGLLYGLWMNFRDLSWPFVIGVGSGLALSFASVIILGFLRVGIIGGNSGDFPLSAYDFTFGAGAGVIACVVTWLFCRFWPWRETQRPQETP